MLQQEFGIKKTYLSLHPQSHRRSFTHCNKSEKKLQISFGRFKKGCTFAAPKNREKTKLKKKFKFFQKRFGDSKKGCTFAPPKRAGSSKEITTVL